MDTHDTKLLLVEDDVRLSHLIKNYLASHGIVVDLVHHGSEAGRRIVDEQPDMVILDLMLPGQDGLSVLQTARTGYEGPVLILTAKEDDEAQIKGFELGADDYVQKPVDPRVLLARVQAIFRRTGSGPGEKPALKTIRFGGLEIDLLSRSVSLFDKPVTLSTIEFDILACFAEAPGQVLDRDLLYRTVKGIDYDGQDRSMDVAVSRLRKKLEDHPEKPFRIKTVWGSGYLFDPHAWEEGDP